MSNISKLQHARDCFLKEQYVKAIEYYIEAGMEIGAENVQANIKLCEESFLSNLEPKMDNSISYKTIQNFDDIKSQLSITQVLLEDYYERYQQLKLKSINN